MLGWHSELPADIEPDVVAFECILRTDLTQPFHLGPETGFAESRRHSRASVTAALVTEMQSEHDYCIDPGLIEKALLAAEESTPSG